MGHKWMGDKFMGDAKRDISRKLHLAGWTWVRHARRRSGELVSSGGRTPSPPGGFPAKDTGEHRMGIDTEQMPSGLVQRVGTNTLHSKFLEKGTTKMKPRPWMFLTNAEMRGNINRILTRRMK